MKHSSMAKVLALVLALMMVFSCVACAKQDAPVADEEAAADAEVTTEEVADKYVVGICQLVTHVALDAATQGFKDALIEELGEDAVEFQFQDAAGEANTCSSIVNAFVSDDVDLILANATPALQAAQAATGDIPILGTSVTEYGVALGIENFDGLVGGNISGTSDLAPLDQQAQMLADWFPVEEYPNVGLLYCSAEANSQYQVDTVTAELEAMGYTCTAYPFSDSNDIAAITQQAADNSDVIYVPTDNKVADNTGIIDGICQGAGVPIIAGEEGICSGCGVATLSISYYDLGYTTGKMAAQILTGEADISTMEIAYAENFTYKYNPTICEALSLTAPADYVAIGE